MSRVAVLGGGPAGLYAALLLARRGIPVTVLEREDRPGGLTAGTEVDGMSVDFGSHRLHASIDPDILEDMNEVLGGDLQMRARNGRIRMDGSWISFPIRARDVLTGLRPLTVFRLGAGAFRAMATPIRSDTFADVVETGLGRVMGEMFYFPYARKIWGVSPHQLSGEQARRRISADSPWRLVRRALSSGGEGTQFLYPRHGFGQIGNGLAASASKAGAEIRFSTAVTAVVAHPSGSTVHTSGGVLEADLVLSTIPITTLARFLDPPPHIVASLEALRYRAMVLVYLSVPADRWTSYDAHYFPGPEVPFTRVSEPKNYRDGPDPSGLTVICAEIPCQVGDSTWDDADDALVARVRQGLVVEGLPDPGARGEVRRLRNVYPVYRLGFEEALKEISEWLAGRSGVVTFGRQGLYAHDNTHHALAMARSAVACVTPDIGFDHAAWDEAKTGFARHVVED